MTAERVELRLTAVPASDVKGCPHGGRIAASRTSWLKRLVYMWVAAAVVLVVSIGETAAQSKSGETAVQPKAILFLHSFGQNFQPFASWSREIARELNRQSPWPLDIQEQSLVTARGGDDPSEAKFVEYLKALYAHRPPDLIVVSGAPAARFAQLHRADLYPTTPMLLAGLEGRQVDQSMLSEHDVVVALRFNMPLFSKTFCGCCRRRRPSQS